MTSSYFQESQLPQRTLLGPGPSSVNPRVLQAMTAPVAGHLDPAFSQVMDDVSAMLRQVFHTQNSMTMPISSTGTGAMETACVNVLEPGDTVVVCRNGYFGERLADIAQRCGAEVHLVDSPWGKPLDVQALADELAKHPKVKAVGVVHAETSTGVLTPMPEITEADTPARRIGHRRRCHVFGRA
jgi:alanine-glyoxylate transaminase/serine-glyoxylate transaminase/serine-pyruvate transaminase